MELKDCKVGMQVNFGRSQGEQTLGEIVKVNAVKCKVKQLESRGTMRNYPVGTVWTVPVSLLTPVEGSVKPVAAKRPDAVIMSEINDCYNRLSPENLHCDGEISRSAAARKAVALNARLRHLFQEIGRKVSEDEAYRSYSRL
jgi:hypothetical protein